MRNLNYALNIAACNKAWLPAIIIKFTRAVVRVVRPRAQTPASASGIGGAKEKRSSWDVSSGLQGETEEEMLQRRRRESEVVEQRTRDISSRAELASFLDHVCCT